MALCASRQQTLLLDADDTLWENNIYFERSISNFISFLNHGSYSPAQVREHLNAVERRTIAERGYGTESFRISLLRCFEELSCCAPAGDQHARITQFVDAIVTAEMELIEGVQEALSVLQQEHRLILVTKGNRLEQLQKLERSGLASCFTAAEVLAEKDAEGYREVGRRYACDPRSTWMIGNSPRSDTNPALTAGFHAVLIPHSGTWVLEEEELSQPPAGQRLLVLERLSELPTVLKELHT